MPDDDLPGCLVLGRGHLIMRPLGPDGLPGNPTRGDEPTVMGPNGNTAYPNLPTLTDKEGLPPGCLSHIFWRR